MRKEEVQIIIGKTAGFCYGVNNAVTKMIEILEESQCDTKLVYCLGEIVHNGKVVERIEKLGAKTIETVEQIKEKSKVVIRAHGVPPDIYKGLEQKKCEIVDLTCPNVQAIHKIVEEFSKKNFYIFIIGKKSHPETIGTHGFCSESSIIENEEDIEQAMTNFEMSKREKVLIIVQTTFSLEKFNKYSEVISKRLEKQNIEYVLKNTICNATKLRQEETNEISKKVDFMIIVGGKNSSNTKKLYEISKANCINTISLESVEELPIEEILNMVERNKELKIGIMAGASTPKESIEGVVNKLNIFTQNLHDIN